MLVVKVVGWIMYICHWIFYFSSGTWSCSFINSSSIVHDILSKDGYNFIFVSRLIDGRKYSICYCQISHDISRDFVVESTTNAMRTGIFFEELVETWSSYLVCSYFSRLRWNFLLLGSVLHHFCTQRESHEKNDICYQIYTILLA